MVVVVVVVVVLVVVLVLVVLAAVLAEGGWSMKEMLVVLKIGLPCSLLLVVALLVAAVRVVETPIKSMNFFMG